MWSKSEKRRCEPQGGRAPWLSAAPGGGWILLLEAGAGVLAGNLVLCAKGWAPRRQSLQLLLEPGVGTPCPPSKWRPLLPLAQALRGRYALPSGERQGDLVPERERLEREATGPGPSAEQSGQLGQAGQALC